MSSKEKISCIIGTKNAEKDIKDCLEAVKWCDEIIVVDDFSTDRTIEFARQYTDKVFQKHFRGYAEQKDFALQKTSNQWILSLDADERITPQLKDEILEKLSKSPEFSGFLFRRMNIFLGREVRHCGWYEADNLRLFNKEKVKYDLSLKYLEPMSVSGQLGVMKNDLLHYTCRSLDDYLKRVNLWSSLNAEDLFNKGVNINPLNSIYYFIFKPLAVFFQKYIFKSGFKDGFVGFLICGLSSITYFISYAKLWEKQKSVNKE
jgi:glycosyltransferase involved in cell wall biosynthesis